MQDEVDVFSWDAEKWAAFFAVPDRISVEEFEMAYNPQTKRYEKGYRLPDGSKFNKDTDWKNFLTYENLREWTKNPSYGYYRSPDKRRTLPDAEYIALLTKLKNDTKEPTIHYAAVEAPTVSRETCDCAKAMQENGQRPPKGVTVCVKCGQPWFRDANVWRRITQFRYDEIMGVKARKPRAKKGDLGKKSSPKPAGQPG